MRAQIQKLHCYVKHLALILVLGMNKSYFYRRNKSNRLKAANDAFNTNHSQKQVGIDFFFPSKLFILTYFVKAIFWANKRLPLSNAALF